MERTASIRRTTKETDIDLVLSLDRDAFETNIRTGFGMLDHMLELTTFWAGFSLRLSCTGDLHIDAHHTAEDIGICLGQALLETLGNRAGIARVGYGRVPMDEALAEVTIDISGRPWLEWRDGDLLPPVIAHEESDIWREFYKAFASAAKMNLHVCFNYGRNGHHLLESAAKGLGLALAAATEVHSATVRSTKGSLD